MNLSEWVALDLAFICIGAVLGYAVAKLWRVER